MAKEHEMRREDKIDAFKTSLMANFPHRAEAILSEFAVDETLAPKLSEEELEQQPGYNSDEIEAAIDLMKTIGFGHSDLSE